MKMENKMGRFYVDDKRWVIDRANRANSRLYRIHISEAGDEEHLRESVLLVRLEGLLGKLHGPSAPKRNKRGRKRRRFEKALWVLRGVLIAVGASHMSQQSAARSPHHRFNDQLRRENGHFGGITSLALFFDDIELLLRDLYGDFDQSAASAVRYALHTVLCWCLRRSLPKDIWKEHWDARTIDHGWYGVGLDPGDGISTNSVWQADEAANDLARRIRAFRANPKAYSKYTHQFVHILDERWPKFDVQDHHFYPAREPYSSNQQRFAQH
jgi:hypothetical protein